MKTNRNKKERRYCPVVKDVVHVGEECVNCGFWDGLDCTTGDLLELGFKAARASRARFNRLLRGRPFPKRGGRSLRKPKLREKWPVTGSEDPADEEEQDEYGIVELENHDVRPRRRKKKRRYLLPEEREHWDIKPDVPDWIPTLKKQGDPELAEDPQSWPFSSEPPGGPEQEGPQDDMPVTPPDIFGEPMT
jgi:hypothetical protein